MIGKHALGPADHGLDPTARGHGPQKRPSPEGERRGCLLHEALSVDQHRLRHAESPKYTFGCQHPNGIGRVMEEPIPEGGTNPRGFDVGRTTQGSDGRSANTGRLVGQEFQEMGSVFGGALLPDCVDQEACRLHIRFPSGITSGIPSGLTSGLTSGCGLIRGSRTLDLVHNASEFTANIGGPQSPELRRLKGRECGRCLPHHWTLPPQDTEESRDADLGFIRKTLGIVGVLSGQNPPPGTDPQPCFQFLRLVQRVCICGCRRAGE